LENLSPQGFATLWAVSPRRSRSGVVTDNPVRQHVYYRLVPLLEGDHRDIELPSSSEAALLDESDVPKHRYFKDGDERPRRPEYDPKLSTKEDIQDHHLRKVLNFRSLPKCRAAVSYRKSGMYDEVSISYF